MHLAQHKGLVPSGFRELRHNSRCWCSSESPRTDVTARQRRSSIPVARQPAPLSARFTPDLFASAEFCAIVRLMARGKAGCTYASRLHASMTRAVEEALSDAFQTEHKSGNVGLKNSPYHFVKSTLNEMVHKMTLDEAFGRDVKQ